MGSKLDKAIAGLDRLRKSLYGTTFFGDEDAPLSDRELVIAKAFMLGGVFAASEVVEGSEVDVLSAFDATYDLFENCYDKWLEDVRVSKEADRDDDGKSDRDLIAELLLRLEN